MTVKNCIRNISDGIFITRKKHLKYIIPYTRSIHYIFQIYFSDKGNEY